MICAEKVSRSELARTALAVLVAGVSHACRVRTHWIVRRWRIGRSICTVGQLALKVSAS